MSINVYDFNKFDGYAEVEEQGSYELRIYLSDNCNCETVILSKVGNTYHLYNFIADSQHLKNMSDINWFSPIKSITLNVKKVNKYLTQFINYALKCGVEVKIASIPF